MPRAAVSSVCACMASQRHFTVSPVCGHCRACIAPVRCYTRPYGAETLSDRLPAHSNNRAYIVRCVPGGGPADNCGVYIVPGGGVDRVADLSGVLDRARRRTVQAALVRPLGRSSVNLVCFRTAA